ncbi:MAG: DNA polymerase III subunit epsilon, partial [Chryseobacterium sp.]
IKFNHHRAGDDAEACARISLLAFEKLFITRNEEIDESFHSKLKKL